MDDLKAEIARLRDREDKLCEITALLTGETDLQSLLDRIVTSLRTVTSSDAGSLYILQGEDTLRFSVAQNDSKNIPFKSFTLPISSTNIAGHVALTGEVLKFDDVYGIDAQLPYRFNADFDRNFGYRTKSMVTMPMKNRLRRTVGVLQLINKKRDAAVKLDQVETAEREILPYTDDDVDFLGILASQAAIVIERAALYDGIERLLRGFVESSTKSIESRDKVTAGHSQRIAAYMVALAKRMNRATEGPFKDVQFSHDEIRELFYSAMLHDIGKIGVREYVLMKENKLTNERLEAIRLKVELEIMHDRSREAFWRDVLQFIETVNVPSFLDDAKLARLQETGKLQVRDASGSARPLLSPDDLENLSVRRGNLTERERKEIESHVWHSAEILKAIPWTENLRRVPLIAGTHHERLNGKGYPFGLTKDEILFEGRMLAVADVFEALTAMDRPYKRAVPVPKALDIILEDARGGGLQLDIVEFFIEQRVHEVVTDDMRKHFTLTSDEILAIS